MGRPSIYFLWSAQVIRWPYLCLESVAWIGPPKERARCLSEASHCVQATYKGSISYAPEHWDFFFFLKAIPHVFLNYDLRYSFFHWFWLVWLLCNYLQFQSSCFCVYWDLWVCRFIVYHIWKVSSHFFQHVFVSLTLLLRESPVPYIVDHLKLCHWSMMLCLFKKLYFLFYLDSSYCCIFKFNCVFLYMSNLPLILSVCLSFPILQFLSLKVHFRSSYLFHVFTYLLTIWNAVPPLMTLLANSNIILVCFDRFLSSLSISVISCFFACLVIFDWIPNILSFILLDAGNFVFI